MKMYYVASGKTCGTCPHRHRNIQTAAKCALKHQTDIAKLNYSGSLTRSYSDRSAHQYNCRIVKSADATKCTCKVSEQ